VEVRRAGRRRGLGSDGAALLPLRSQREHPANTGVASVGNFGAPGQVDYTAIGRQVNLAARLQVSCDPGRILISHVVLVRDEIPCEPKGEIQVKGIRDAVKVYEVTAPYPVEAATRDAAAGGAAG
jgi:class 3 adenylate cyclase